MSTAFEPALTYNKGTSTGHAGTDTSRDAEKHRRGVQEQVMAYLWAQGVVGATMREACQALGRDHSTVSSALTNLNNAGELEYLQEKRGAGHVYVHRHFVNGRPLAARRKKVTYTEQQVARLVSDAYMEGFMAATGGA